jgi:hypothetical protein
VDFNAVRETECCRVATDEAALNSPRMQVGWSSVGAQLRALVRSRKGSDRWKIGRFAVRTWGRNARTVTRPGVLLAERFASAVASFEGRVGACSHQAWMQALANQVGQALSATNSASDSARSRQHSSPIASTKVARQIPNKHGWKRERLRPGSAQSKRLPITNQQRAPPT